MSEFKNPIDVAVGLIPVLQNGEVVLAGIVRGKAGDDGYGSIALPGGYVDEGESIEDAVAREVEQEINFKTGPRAWRLLHSRHVPGKNLNLVFALYRGDGYGLLAQDILKNAVPNEEVRATLYISKTTKLAFSLHEEAVQLYYSWYKREQELTAKYGY